MAESEADPVLSQDEQLNEANLTMAESETDPVLSQEEQIKEANLTMDESENDRVFSLEEQLEEADLTTAVSEIDPVISLEEPLKEAEEILLELDRKMNEFSKQLALHRELTNDLSRALQLRNQKEIELETILDQLAANMDNMLLKDG